MDGQIDLIWVEIGSPKSDGGGGFHQVEGMDGM